MGYYANGGGSLHISKENFEPMKQAVQHWMQDDVPDWKPNADIVCFFNAFGFEADLDENGNVDGVWFPEDKIRNVDTFLETIAPWVEDRSRIEMTGEDGEHWLWCFKDHEFFECNGVITYEGDPYAEEKA